MSKATVAVEKTFAFIGTSFLKEAYKIRFANDLSRIKTLVKTGHTEIELVELPEPMAKPAAVAWLFEQDEFAGNQEAVEVANDKYNVVKVKKSKAKAKAKPSMEDIKSRAPVVDCEVDPEAVA